jgi:hypothetical protein
MKKLLLIASLFVGCKNDAPEVERAAPACVPTSISYQRDIKPIIRTNCAFNSGCHGSGSPNGNFFKYDELNAACISGAFNKKVFIQKTMPPVGLDSLGVDTLKLDSCDFLTLRRWYNNGHYN